MSKNLNMGKATVNLAGHWQAYAMKPDDLKMIGTVTRSDETRALGVDAAGEYWALLNRRRDHLVKRKINAAIAAAVADSLAAKQKNTQNEISEDGDR